ncbi:MAG: DUF4239 domain-containing protein [Gammaproteobacteria bacterium]|nr:DUF4239 domain-containing protein [Gammaproteobacteria bacterium]
MFDYLYRISDIKLFILLTLVSVTLSLIAIFLVRRFIPVNLRYIDNQVIGNTISLVSVLYGVLAGLAALYLINNNSYASDAVQREANSIANIFRDTRSLKEPARTSIQTEVKQYIDTVINIEWPLMRKGAHIDHEGDTIIDNIADEINNYYVIGESESRLVRDLLEENKSLYNSRQQRITMSYASLDIEIWIVILIGTILTMSINYLFGMNFYLHMVTVIAAAIMTSSMIFLLITLDRPFQGEFIIEPVALKSVLHFIEDHPSEAPS